MSAAAPTWQETNAKLAAFWEARLPVRAARAVLARIEHPLLERSVRAEDFRIERGAIVRLYDEIELAIKRMPAQKTTMEMATEAALYAAMYDLDTKAEKFASHRNEYARKALRLLGVEL